MTRKTVPPPKYVSPPRAAKPLRNKAVLPFVPKPKAAGPLPKPVAQRNVRKPVAPPVYRPKQVPKVLQAKSASAQQPHTGQVSRLLVVPPVYAPNARKIVQRPLLQPKLAKLSPVPPLQPKVIVPTPPIAQRVAIKPVTTPVYRPQQVPKVLQKKSVSAQLSRIEQLLCQSAASLVCNKANIGVVKQRAVSQAPRSSHTLSVDRPKLEKAAPPTTNAYKDRLALAHQIARQAKLSGPVQGKILSPRSHQVTTINLGIRQPRSGQIAGQIKVIQPQFTFATTISSWKDDSRSACRWCMAPVKTFSRHHCRVCGELVCNACSPKKFLVTNPQTSSGRRTDGSQSEERVCVNCVLERQIEIAAKHSLKFRELRQLAKDPYVEWQVTWPHCTGRKIILNPHKEDPFNTYVFELTNAVDMNEKRVKEEPKTVEDYAFGIEYTEYLGTLWHNEVVEDINAGQNLMAVQQRFAPNRPDKSAFKRHMDHQVKAGHTKLYHDQWQAKQEKKARELRRVMQETRNWLADTELAWRQVRSRRG